MKKKILIIAFYLVSFMMIAGLLGCFKTLFVHPPDAKDRERINSGEYAIVIFRVIFLKDDKPVESFPYALAVGTFKTGGEVKHRYCYYLSVETKKDGWAYLLLEPGLQYLAAQPYGMSGYESRFQTAATLKIDIPSKTPIVYIGTLHIPCILDKNKRLSVIGDKIVVVNEEDRARELAAGFLSEYGVPKTMLMQQHKGPKIFRNPQKTE